MAAVVGCNYANDIIARCQDACLCTVAGRKEMSRAADILEIIVSASLCVPIVLRLSFCGLDWIRLEVGATMSYNAGAEITQDLQIIYRTRRMCRLF